MNRSYSKIRHIQESNRLLEERRLLIEQAVDNTWLTVTGDKNYTYQKQNNKWVAKNKAGKILDISKYPTTIQKLESQFPGGKAPVNNPQVGAVGADGKPQVGAVGADGNIAPTTNTVNTATVKNETLPGASVYYPWVQDGKINFDKFKQSYKSDPNFQNWYSELVKLTTEQLAQVRKDWRDTGFPLSSNDKYKYDTNVGVGLAVIDIIRNAETAVANKGG